MNGSPIAALHLDNSFVAKMKFARNYFFLTDCVLCIKMKAENIKFVSVMLVLFY